MRALAALVLVVGISGVAEAQGAPDLTKFTLIDLTHAFEATTLYWPTSPSAFELTTLAAGPTPGGYFYSSYKLCTPEHGGTHLDAPVHFSKTGRSTADVPLEQLMAPAIVIDVSQQAADNPDYRVTAQDVERFEAAHGRITAGTIVLVRTGWSRFWPDRKRYLGDDTPGDASKLMFPGIGEDAARMLVDGRHVAAMGIDTASIDYGPSTDFKAHRVGAAANVVNLENLTALERLPASGFSVIALPMKIAGGSGGPARVVALVPAQR